MESCPTQAVLRLVGVAAEKVTRDRYNSEQFSTCTSFGISSLDNQEGVYYLDNVTLDIDSG
ncbi:MAG: hypothetical protein ACQESR_20115 [Planctomycetota bacterium]